MNKYWFEFKILCNFFFRSDEQLWGIKNLLKSCLPKLTTFSIGCLEDFTYYLEDIIQNLDHNKITHLGLASVKDDPVRYQPSYFNSTLINAFTHLKVSFPYKIIKKTFRVYASCLHLISNVYFNRKISM